MFYVLMLLFAVAGIAAYLLLFLSHVPGAREERLGEYEPLPENLGRWTVVVGGEPGQASGDEGLVREERLLLQEGGRRLIKQVRYRHPETREIVRVDPEELIVRRRLRPAPR
ncbi:MAG: hypothetical protein GX607_03670 [Myxococcales bacterium]|nr:hypothetical protein [Myxococcales bacterium]